MYKDIDRAVNHADHMGRRPAFTTNLDINLFHSNRK